VEATAFEAAKIVGNSCRSRAENFGSETNCLRGTIPRSAEDERVVAPLTSEVSGESGNPRPRVRLTLGESHSVFLSRFAEFSIGHAEKSIGFVGPHKTFKKVVLSLVGS
jgi:hypothetical protein